MKVYIAGPISGMPDNNKRAFEEAKEYLSELGLEPVSPLDGVTNLDAPYVEFIKRGLDLLNSCQAIYLLRDWNQSPGARIEKIFAKRMGKIVLNHVPNASLLCI